MTRTDTDRAGAGIKIDSREVLEAFGERIVRLRAERRWSRVDLARKLRVSRERLAKWEGGKNAPPLEMLVAFKRALGVSLDELITGESPGRESLTSHDQVVAALCLDQLATLLRVGGAGVEGEGMEPDFEIGLPGHEGPEV